MPFVRPLSFYSAAIFRGQTDHGGPASGDLRSARTCDDFCRFALMRDADDAKGQQAKTGGFASRREPDHFLLAQPFNRFMRASILVATWEVRFPEPDLV